MSIYAVNRMCHQLMHDKNFRHAMQNFPEQMVARLDITDEERQAVLAGDVGKLYLMGANAFLLGYLTRFEVLGLSLPVYNERMRAVAGQVPKRA
jgi:aromatic-ring opening dioxygenase LigAB LigA subunit